jgi:hypothetical protein
MASVFAPHVPDRMDASLLFSAGSMDSRHRYLIATQCVAYAHRADANGGSHCAGSESPLLGSARVREMLLPEAAELVRRSGLRLGLAAGPAVSTSASAGVTALIRAQEGESAAVLQWLVACLS